MASVVYNRAKFLMMNGGVDLDTDDIRCALVTSSYTVNADHDFVADLTNELSGGNYVRKAFAGESVSLDDTNDRAFFDATDPIWTALGAAAGTPAALVVFKQVTNDADSPLLFYCELTTPPTPNGGDYTVVLNAGGIARVS